MAAGSKTRNNHNAASRGVTAERAGSAEGGVLSQLPPDVELTAAKRHALERLLAGRAEYVAHPMFRTRKAEKLLFGEGAGGIEAVERSAARRGRSGRTARNGGDSVLLSSEQERLLFLRYNFARYRISVLKRRIGSRPITAEQLRQLLLWFDRSQQAREELVSANMPLVLAMAKRCRIGGVDFGELISEGYMALLRSIDKFDCSRGFKFSTYACRAILKSFARASMKSSRYRSQFPMQYDPKLERSDWDEQLHEQAEQAVLEDLHKVIAGNLAQLSQVEQTVINSRFSLGSDRKAMTLEQVGRRLGVTKERVRQIQNKALHKMREALEEQLLSN